MCLSKVIIILLFALGIWYLIMTLDKPNPLLGPSGKENYGGRRPDCDERCYSSPYYDACMNVCMNDSASGWTGQPDSYEISALEAPTPLDEESGQSYVSFSGPYRYDYPGH